MASRIGRFGPHLKELRIHLCQTSKESEGVRNFITKYYVDIKNSNGRFPILIRECSGVQPRLWARYEKGKESCVSLTNLTADDVLSQLESLARKK
ncbi:hypothetical protein ILUMI_08434 [Ignelater luminosus]|uniref:NADH dehydrogenase [ubiquinone] 1 alpha subcomplex subunit 2 n=1 Tax=Ignelater luminosus TaxID=2038154 RepID=A0A8K0D6W3_IGNLU|nr:hypothetical protein ILUMI_08434 [Ignelater luminosus]